MTSVRKESLPPHSLQWQWLWLQNTPLVINDKKLAAPGRAEQWVMLMTSLQSPVSSLHFRDKLSRARCDLEICFPKGAKQLKAIILQMFCLPLDTTNTYYTISPTVTRNSIQQINMSFLDCWEQEIVNQEQDESLFCLLNITKIFCLVREILYQLRTHFQICLKSEVTLLWWWVVNI